MARIIRSWWREITGVFALLLGIFCGHSEAAVVYKSSLACQGERVRLHCRNASMGLSIYSASYGRTEPGAMFCPYKGAESDKDYNCGERDVTDTFKMLCERKNRCRVKVHSALFRDPCPEKPKKHLYLMLIYTCDWQKRKPKVIHTSTSSSIVTTETSSIPVPTSSLVSFSSFTSMTIFPTIDVIASTSSVLISRHTPHVKESPSIRTTSTKEGDSGVDNVLDHFQEGQANSATKHAAGSLGIAGTLFMWLLFMQDHSSDYTTVFCTSAAGALALAIIAGLLVLYRHHANKQHLQVKEESKLNPYGSTKPKISAEIDPFLAGPIKTPPPDYMMEGYNRQRGGTMPLKKSQNGTIVRTFSAKDVHTKEPNDESVC